MFVNDCLVQEPKVAKLSRIFGLLRFRVAWGRAGDVLWPMAPSSGQRRETWNGRTSTSSPCGVQSYQRPLHLTPEEDSQIVRSLTLCRQGERRERMVAIAITRLDLTAAELTGGVGEEPGRAGGAADAGAGAGSGGRGPEDCGGDLRHGPADAAGLGASLQRRGAGRAFEPSGRAAAAAARSRSSGRARGLAGGRPRSGETAWSAGGGGPAAADRGFCCGIARAHDRQTGGSRFRRLSVRPQHPQSEPEEQVVFKKASPIP